MSLPQEKVRGLGLEVEAQRTLQALSWLRSGPQQVGWLAAASLQAVMLVPCEVLRERRQEVTVLALLAEVQLFGQVR